MTTISQDRVLLRRECWSVTISLTRCAY